MYMCLLIMKAFITSVMIILEGIPRSTRDALINVKKRRAKLSKAKIIMSVLFFYIFF